MFLSDRCTDKTGILGRTYLLEGWSTDELAVTLYTPPKAENKKVSDWFLEYALALIKWYGIESGGRGDL